MKKLALGFTLAVVAATGFVAACSKDKPKIKLTDASDDAGSTVCDPIAQTGCPASQKCTWFHDDTGDATTDPRKPADGHTGCAPLDTSTVDLKGACTYGAPGATGYDNCKPGLLCDTAKDAEPQGRCERICDPTMGTNCENNIGCVRKHGVFAAVGAGDATTPGTCQILCDPFLDNDYDGSGTASAQRAGSPCESDANAGCWGRISAVTTSRSFFFCSHSVPGTETLVHRKEITAPEKQLLVACHPGYALGFARDATGSMKTDCYSYCKPADAIGSSGSGTIGSAGGATNKPIAIPNPQRPAGDPADPCNLSKGRTGDFNDAIVPGDATKRNGEHCMYTWRFEIDMAGTLFPSPTSNTVGICYDHLKYQDSAGAVLPACTDVPASDATPMNTTITGVSLGCLSLTTLGLQSATLTGKSSLDPVSIPELKSKPFPIEFPSMSNRWQSAAMR